MKKLLILGHSGYVGKFVYEFYRQKNKSYKKYEITGKSSKDINFLKKNSYLKLKKIINKKTTVIICTAIKSTLGNNIKTYTLNNKIIENICKGLSLTSPKKVIYLSSKAIYGVNNNHRNFHEESKIECDTFYSLTKFIAENLLNKVVKKKNLIIVRPSIVYGPREEIYQGSPSGYLKNVISNKPLHIWGSGKEIRNFIYINDLVKIINFLVHRNFSGVLNATGEHSTYIKIIRKIEKLSQKKSKVVSKIRTKKKVDKSYSNKKLLNLMPKFKFTPISAGIQKILNIDYKKY